MRVAPECIHCILRQCIEAARFATGNEQLVWEIVSKLLGQLQEMRRDLTPPEVSQVAHRLVREYTSNPDPYEKAKRQFNLIARGLYPKLEKIVNSSKESLYDALKLAIAGNVIDFAIDERIDAARAIEDVMKADFAINDVQEFREELGKSKDILFIADNAGEVFFDKLLIEQLSGLRITYVVKGSPILNDATLEDAKFAELDKFAEIITTGTDAVGVIFGQTSREFQKHLGKADMIIAKGHGNYESLEETDYNAFFLLKAKCAAVAKSLGVGVAVGNIVLKRNRKKGRS